jgi:competence protein ComEA
MLPEWIRSYLYFHRKERNGLLTLLVLIGLIVAYNVHLRLTAAQRQRTEVLRFGPSIERFRQKIELADSLEQYAHYGDHTAPVSKGERFGFDPNTLDSAGWTRLGFSPRQAASVIKYRSKGGSFRKPEDLLRLYWMDSLRYEELVPFIEITDRSSGRVDYDRPQTFIPSQPIIVDINLADTVGLTNLKGIGPAFAARIVKYRNRLGGFRNSEQLLEVFGMDSIRFAGLVGQVVLDTSDLRRTDINTADFKELIANPYISKSQVNALLRYREQHGAFRSVSDLQKIHLFTPESYRKLEPYLTAR